MLFGIGSVASQTRLLFHNAAAHRFVGRTTERLATGLRINRASDDPSGTIAAEKLRSDLIDINAKLRVNHSLRGQNRIREGGLRPATEVLHELRGLVHQASGNTNSADERQAIQSQVDASLDALQSIASASDSSPLPPSVVKLRTGGSANLIDGDLNEAAEVIDQALDANTAARVEAGVYEKYTLDVDRRLAEAQAVAAAKSLSAIEDADYAQEASNLVVGGILAEASLRTLALSKRIQMQQATAVFDRLF